MWKLSSQNVVENMVFQASVHVENMALKGENLVENMTLKEHNFVENMGFGRPPSCGNSAQYIAFICCELCACSS